MIRRLTPLSERPPLRTLFVLTGMGVGGEEMVTLEVLKRLDRTRFAPHLACLKELGACGEEAVAAGIPARSGLIRHKFDVAVLWRLMKLLREWRIDAVLTVGTGGDKMFWGRLAALGRRVPVIASAIHSTGHPLTVGRLNRLLTPWTDAFVAVAGRHGEYITRHEGCPAEKVHVIPNGVDADRFRPLPPDPALRQALGLPPDAPVMGIVAVVRPEKNHALWLRIAGRVRRALPAAQFLIVGDGPERPKFEELARTLGLGEAVHFVGRRRDTPQLLNQMDLFLLTSDMEANPVSILEAGACGKPVVATGVGSIPETVLDGRTGLLAAPGDEDRLAAHALRLLSDRATAAQMGAAARSHVAEQFSVAAMVRGYEDLLAGIYERKAGTAPAEKPCPVEARSLSL